VIKSGHNDPITGLADLSYGRLMSCSRDEGCKLFDLATGQNLRSIELGQPLYSMCDLGNGEVMVGGYDGFVRVLDVYVDPPRVLDPFGEQQPIGDVDSIASSRGGPVALADYWGQSVWLLD